MRLLAVTIAVAVAGTVTACTTSSVATSPDTTTATPKTTTARHVAHPGDSITVKSTGGEKLTITLIKVVNPTRGGQFDTPTAGHQYAAAQVRITNAGTVAYDDAPSNGARLIDATGQQFEATIISSVAAGPLLPASVKLGPGDSALGLIPFEVPKGSHLKGFQFTTQSGFGDTAQWAL